jgi:hypothetical protein
MYSNFIGTFTKSGYVNEETQKNDLPCSLPSTIDYIASVQSLIDFPRASAGEDPPRLD